MFEAASIQSTNKHELYHQLAEQAKALLGGESDRIANAANLCALIFQSLPDINWAGFYFFDGKELVVGPFQGKPACIRIPMGAGVCGTAAKERRSIVVADVNEFNGHIACDVASRSEVVVPIYCDDELIGVLDIDSPTPARFDDDDRDGVEKLASVFLNRLS